MRPSRSPHGRPSEHDPVAVFEVLADHRGVGERDQVVDQHPHAPHRAQLAEAIIAEEWNDRIDLVGNSLEVEEHQHLAHVWRDIVADDLDRLRHDARPRRRNSYRPYSSWRRHHAYGGVCGYPSGESSHSSWRPSGVRSRKVQTGPSASTPRPAVK